VTGLENPRFTEAAVVVAALAVDVEEDSEVVVDDVRAISLEYTVSAPSCIPNAYVKFPSSVKRRESLGIQVYVPLVPNAVKRKC